MLIVKPEKVTHQNYSKNYLSKQVTTWSSFTTPEDTWCGRHVKVLDGSTVSMPDTNENQKAYPQPSSQKAGCGREGGILSDLCNLKVILWRYSPLPAFS